MTRKIAILLVILLIISISLSCRRRRGGDSDSSPTSPSEVLSISSVVPNSGPIEGGIPAILKGKGFADGALLRIGVRDASDVVVNSSEEISFKTPPGNIGPKEVRVTNPDGETVILSSGFTYIPGEGLFVIMGFLLPIDSNTSNKVRLGDIDRDGDIDIFIANEGPNSLYLNDGNGRFDNRSADLPELITNTDKTRDVRLGDIDNDGYLDIILANDDRNSKIYINNRDGSFTSILLPVKGCSKAIDLADIDKDSDLDILIVNFYNTNDCPEITRLFLNEGGASFRDVTTTNLPEVLTGRYSSRAGIFSDVNGDGYPDIIIANLLDSNLLYINNGDGSFRDARDALPLRSADSTAIATGDVDEDGDIDILFFTLDEEILYLNEGNGIFMDASEKLPDISDRTWDGRLIDVDGDGDLDIIKINDGQNLIYINDGKAKFFDLTTGRMPIAEAEGMGMDIGDINGDGYPDIVIANGGISGQQNRIYFGNGLGAFFDATGNFPVDTGMTKDIAIGDIDGDGYPDMILANYRGNIRVFLGDGERNFSEVEGNPVPPTNEDAYEAVRLFDMDADSDPDLIIINGEGQKDRLYRNDSNPGSIVFTDITDTHLSQVAGGDGREVATGDIDNDGDEDIIVANIGKERIWINDPATGSFTDETDKRLPPEPVENTSSASVLLADLNGDGYLDIILSNNNMTGTDTNKQNRLYINRGTSGPGVFDDLTDTHLPQDKDDDTMEIAAADIDGDGDLDLAVANDNIGNTCKNRLYLNEGDGHFTDVSLDRLPPDCDGTRGVSFVDVEGDGDIDIIFVNDRQDRLYLNDGTGGFVDSVRNLPKDLDDGYKVRITDLDMDGDPDIIIANDGQDRIYVNINR